MKKYTEQFESMDRLRQSNVSSVSIRLNGKILRKFSCIKSLKIFNQIHLSFDQDNNHRVAISNTF